MRAYTKQQINRLIALEALLEGGGSGPIESIGVTAPITSTGGIHPVIGISAATEAAAGSMSAADKTKLDGLPNSAKTLNLVRMTFAGGTGKVASGYTLQPFDYLMVDSTGGHCVVNAGPLTLGQFYTVKQDPATSLANSITINGTGANLEQPLGPPGGNVPPGTFAGASAVVLNSSSELGSSYTWTNAGSAGGYTL